MTRFLRLLPLALLAASLSVHAVGPTGLLNDTGKTACYDDTGVADCATVAADNGTHPRQDGRFGRDRAGMAKTGGGAAGFDFTKVCWNGDLEGSGTCTGVLVANTTAAASSTAETDWACTKDNVTNLVWSLQTVSNATWATATGSGDGSVIKAHNDTKRCGYDNGWRVPTRRELLSIVHHGAGNPAIDGDYFPGTVNNSYWSNDIYAAPGPAGAWYVQIANGNADTYVVTAYLRVRLVRSVIEEP